MMDDDDLVRIGRCPMPRDWLAYYRALRALHAVDFVVLWKEEGYDEFAEMRGSVPPLVARDNAFMVGEPVTASELGMIFDAHVQVGSRFFYRPALEQSFDPAAYRAEIRAMFPGV